jgi:hypothetical protein
MNRRLVIIAALACMVFATGAYAQSWVSCAGGTAVCTNGLVGIRATTPVRDLVIGGGGSATFQLSTLGAGATATDGFQFQQVGINSHLINEQNGFMAFYTNATQRVTLDNTGRLGIGTATPTVALDVVGSINVSGNIAAKYQDIAEWVSSESNLEGGTVVVLSTEQSNHVIASESAYDTKIAGVISDRPGLILGEESKEKSKVATSGRVRVKVDATRHPVKIGDLLVTSDTPGYAMKSQPVKFGGVSMHRPGTIIGKALEGLPSGRGEILVLLSLQ